MTPLRLAFASFLLVTVGCAAPAGPPPDAWEVEALHMQDVRLFLIAAGTDTVDKELAEGAGRAFRRRLEATGLHGLLRSSQEPRPIRISRVHELGPGEEVPAALPGEGIFVMTVTRLPFRRDEKAVPFNLGVEVYAYPSTARNKEGRVVFEQRLLLNAAWVAEALVTQAMSGSP